jgi:thioredoxin-like negative regulator of GroEL
MTDTIVYALVTTECHRCSLFLPTFEEWARKYPTADFVVVNLDQATPELLKQYQVSSVPTIAVLRDEQVVARFVGVPKEEEIARLLE